MRQFPKQFQVPLNSSSISINGEQYFLTRPVGACSHPARAPTLLVCEACVLFQRNLECSLLGCCRR